MNKVEVGKVYKIKDNSKCGFAKNDNATHAKITKIDTDGVLNYDLLRDGKKVNTCYWCLKPEHLELEEKRLEYGHCEEGDIIVDEDGDESTIIKVLENGVWRTSLLSDEKNTAYFSTWKQIEAEDWEIKGQDLTDEDQKAIDRVKELAEEGRVDLVLKDK